MEGVNFRILEFLLGLQKVAPAELNKYRLKTCPEESTSTDNQLDQPDMGVSIVTGLWNSNENNETFLLVRVKPILTCSSL